MTTGPTFDATTLYRSVLNRRARRALINGQRNAAIEMAEVLLSFLRSPSKDGLEDFAHAEQRWLSLVGPHNKSYADVLKNEVAAGRKIVFRITGINSAHNPDYDPSYGYVYGFVSTRYPNLVKLGVTTRKRHPQDRLQEFCKKYAIEDLKIVFFCEVTHPGRAEKLWTTRFHARRKNLGNHESREWFQFTPDQALHETQKIVSDLGLKEYGKWFVAKQIRYEGSAGPIPARKILPGCIAGSQLN